MLMFCDHGDIHVYIILTKTEPFHAFFFIDEKFLKFSDLLESSINVNVMKVLYIDYRRSYICDCVLLKEMWECLL